MKILIIGASGSGTTTLGKALSEATSFQHLDIDDYYWEPTNPPYQIKVPVTERQQRFKEAFEKHEKMIVSGSLVSWGNYWITAFDLVIFVTLQPEIRIKRLQQREIERYGDSLQTDAVIQERSQAFLAWAKRYDDVTFTGRSISVHRDWLGLLSCEILEINSELAIEQNVSKVLETLSELFK
jgi:adenylate kinase family enzyme